MSDFIVGFNNRDPLERLPALAHRLGVEQIDNEHYFGLAVQTRGGERYDLFQLINAVLDRMDRIEKKLEE